MNCRTQLRFFILFTLLLFATPTDGQTGGDFSVTKSVVASGGERMSGGAFGVEGTSGQTAVISSMTTDLFEIVPGFWEPSLAPTAAGVSVSGRVLTADGEGLSGAIVTCMGADGNIRIVRTGSFGYFSFEDIEPGHAYFFLVESKRYVFAPRSIAVIDSVTDLEFLPLK